MPVLRRFRPAVLIAVLLALAAALALSDGSSAATARTARTANTAQTRHAEATIPVSCVQRLLGFTLPPAAGTAGADPSVVTQLAILRRPRTASDTLPKVADLASTLALEGATSFDPSHSVRIQPRGRHGGLFLVPATIVAPTVPAGCAELTKIPGFAAYIAGKADARGSGPGVCLLPIGLVNPPPPPGAFPLPGEATPKPRLGFVGLVRCESLAVMGGYLGAISGGGTPTPILDGVSTITYTGADGTQATSAVSDNLISVPQAFADFFPTGLTDSPTAAQIAARLPTTVTETGPDGATVASLSRPSTFAADLAEGIVFVANLLKTSNGSAGPSSGSSIPGIACSARTHRCLAVQITTTCTQRLRCHTTRRLIRYRYVTRRPPATSSARVHALLAPIVGRLDAVIRHPGHRVRLILSGTRQHDAVLLESVTCQSRHGATATASSQGGPPYLHARVPSSRTVSLPGGQVCAVGALVLSRHPGAVHVRIRR